MRPDTGSRISSRDKLGQTRLLQLLELVHPHFCDQVDFFLVLGAHVLERALGKEVTLGKVFVLGQSKAYV